MFQHILVPLDGSSQAEQALPLAAHIARHTGGCISLLRAIPLELWGEISSSYSRSDVLAEEVHKTLVQEAHDYLEQVSRMDLLAGIALCTQTLIETPAQAILNYAQT